MSRTHYRLTLTAACALAASAGPVAFLEDQFRVTYLLGGLTAALCSWLLLAAAMAAEPHLDTRLQGIAGAGAAVFSWAKISLVAVFAILPHVAREGLALFDPVWIMAGFSPLAVPLVAWYRVRRCREGVWAALFSTLFRFSVPLAGLTVAARLTQLPKQFTWLALFTGIMFLVLDGLGVGSEAPVRAEPQNGFEAKA